MEIRQSSEYVIERSKRLNKFFKNVGWIVTAGKNNCILIYIASDKPHAYTQNQLINTIAETDYHIEATGLRMSDVTYKFYYQGILFEEIEVLPSAEFDVFED